MADNKKFYRDHVWKDAPIFHQPYWLDAVAGDEWDVAVIKENDQLKGYYLYAYKKDMTGFQIVMPALTQFLGPNYKLAASSRRERNNEETELLEELLKQFPPFSYFESRWHFSFQNWLPFHWNNFSQTTRYTYVLEDISNPEKLREQFSNKIKREINKSEKELTAEESNDVKKFYQLLKKNFQGKKISIPFPQSLLETIHAVCLKNESGKIWLSKDNGGKVAAGIFVIWDATTAYYLIGGKDDDFGNSGAMSGLFWNALSELSGKVRQFDFEGSMIKGVENYFRSFGTEQKGFFEISKINSSLQKLKASLRKTLRR